MYRVHVLSLNLNFENPLRIIENYTRVGQIFFGREQGGGESFYLKVEIQKKFSVPPPSDK